VQCSSRKPLYKEHQADNTGRTYLHIYMTPDSCVPVTVDTPGTRRNDKLFTKFPPGRHRPFEGWVYIDPGLATADSSGGRNLLRAASFLAFFRFGFALVGAQLVSRLEFLWNVPSGRELGLGMVLAWASR
jgi:hypothetical protein